jgi:hypothetical protein
MRRMLLRLAGLCLSLAAVAGCRDEESPKATAACSASAADACGDCCTRNGTNTHSYDEDRGCTCALRYWFFLQ